MPYLKFYSEEQKLFPEAYSKKLTETEAKIIVNKLVRHYIGKVPLRIYFTSGNRTSTYYETLSTHEITLNADVLSFGTVCHEVSHLIQSIKSKKAAQKPHRWHTKKLTRIMKRLTNYCAKKNWWTDELKKRTTPKPLPKPPTKEELRGQKIEKAKVKVERYEKKIRFYQRKLARAKRSLKMLQRKSDSTVV